MSRDGSWQFPALPEPVQLPGEESTPDERIAALVRELELRNTWIRQNRDTLEQAKQRAEEAEALVAVLVRKYGESVGTPEAPRYRVVLTDAELTDTPAGALSVNLDPNSGALLIRFRPK